MSAEALTIEDIYEAKRQLFESNVRACGHVFHPRERGVEFGGHRYANCAQCFALLDICHIET